MTIIAALLCSFFLHAVTSDPSPCDVPRSMGMGCTEYSVTCGCDCVILLARLNCTSNGTVVVLWPGLMMTQDCYYLQYPYPCLPLALFNAGYNVWLANLPGTKYSSGLSCCYNVTLDELAQGYRCVVEFILNTTGQPRLVCINHSITTTVCTIALILYPELNVQICLVFQLNFVWSFCSTGNPLFQFCNTNFPWVYVFQRPASCVRVDPNPTVNVLGQLVCGASDTFCQYIANCFGSCDTSKDVAQKLPRDFSSTCTGGLIQLCQAGCLCKNNIGKGFVRHWNYGICPLSIPAAYDLSRVTTKVYSMCGTNDKVCPCSESKVACSMMNNCMTYEFSICHMSFFTDSSAAGVIKLILKLLGYPLP